MILPTVAIVGRPNVGKSSLFNRILRRPVAVVDKQPGVTRDRHYAVCDWAGCSFRLVDTGGIVAGSKEVMDKTITQQAEFAINEAELVLLMVDVQVGIDPLDRTIARKLHKSGRPCLLVTNKVDTESQDADVFEFLKLGLGEPQAVSAAVGRGIGELLDAVLSQLPEQSEIFETDPDTIRVAVVGRPNVGKSSFINRLLGEDRLIVTDIAGTTRDAVDTPIEIGGQQYLMVDTAGLRRKYRVRESIEFYTTLRTERAVDNCDVALVLIDAAASLTSQDQRILELVLERRRAAILVVNKWDTIEKDSLTADRFSVELRGVLAKNAFLPIVYVSALTGQRVAKVMSLVKSVFDESNKRIATAELNDFLERAIARKHPPARGGKYIRFFYVTQSEVAPPTFVFFTNHPTLLDRSYMSFLANQLRSRFGFDGVPIRLKFKKK
ncbi:MAG: ribosome biogenesis GTPase Der [Candidatus Zixiibacteriota bacterium]